MTKEEIRALIAWYEGKFHRVSHTYMEGHSPADLEQASHLAMVLMALKDSI